MLCGWMLFAGMLATHWSQPTLSADYYGHNVAKPGVLLVSLEHKPLLKTLHYQVTVNVTGKKQGEHIVPAKGKLLLYLPIDSTVAALAYGDILAINAKPEPVPSAANPYEFDYRNYLANKYIHYQTMPKVDRWYATGLNDGHWFYKGLETVRAHAVAVLKAHLPPDYAAITASMLLGYRADLSTSLLERYSVTGTIHVLSVSGMHMVLLYGLLVWVLLPIRRTKRPWLRLGLILAVIWLYACLTELSPPVLRASIVFSFFALAQTIHRKPDALNVAAGSALLILLFDPMQLFDVGFQLSYLAVAGIIFLYKPLSRQWPIRNRYLRWVWEGTALSIAAQVATFPLVMYHFHQIPLYSIPANLVVMLLSPVIMYGGLALLVLNWLPGVGWLLGKCLWGGMWLMHESLGLIADAPFSALKTLYPTIAETMLLFAMVVSGTVLFRYPRPKAVIATLLSIMVYLATINLRIYEQKHQQQLVVYQYPKHSAIGVLQGQAAALFIDPSSWEDTVKLERSIYPMMHANGIANTAPNCPPSKQNRYGVVGTRKYALLAKYARHNFPSQKLKVDYLILAQTPKVNMLQLRQVYDADIIVFDGSNHPKVAERWLKECKVLGLDCRSTRHGAFIASW